MYKSKYIKYKSKYLKLKYNGFDGIRIASYNCLHNDPKFYTCFI